MLSLLALLANVSRAFVETFPVTVTSQRDALFSRAHSLTSGFRSQGMTIVTSPGVPLLLVPHIICSASVLPYMVPRIGGV